MKNLYKFISIVTLLLVVTKLDIPAYENEKENAYAASHVLDAYYDASSDTAYNGIEFYYYKVRKGDTLYKLAKRYNRNYAQVLLVNDDLINKAKIYCGQIIRMPRTCYCPDLPIYNGPVTPPTNEEKPPTVTPPTVKPPIVVPPTEEKPPTVKPPTVKPPTDEKPPTTDNMRSEMLEYINRERAKIGIRLLQLDSKVNNVAQVKADDMAINNYFSHNSVKYGTPFQMLTSFGVKYNSAAENIAKGQRSVNEVMKAWLTSEGHRKNLLNPQYNKIGIGYNDAKKTWVQMFIGD